MDDLTFKLNYNQMLGDELANLLNNNYVINYVEIEFDKLIDKLDNFYVLHISRVECISINIFLDTYYNNKACFTCNPIFYICILYANNYFSKNNYIEFTEGIYKSITLKLKKVSIQFFYYAPYENELNYKIINKYIKDKNIIYKKENNIYSKYRNILNYLLDFDYNNIINFYNILLKEYNIIIFKKN